MPNLTEPFSQMDDYFTATIVGLPVSLNLGKTFTASLLRTDQFVGVDAITSEAWLSDSARLVLMERTRHLPSYFKDHESSTANTTALVPVSAKQLNSAFKPGWQAALLYFVLGICTCFALQGLVQKAYGLQLWVRLP